MWNSAFKALNENSSQSAYLLALVYSKVSAFLNSRYANCVYFVIVATAFFTNWNAIEGWGRGDFRNISHKEMTRITIT